MSVPSNPTGYTVMFEAMSEIPTMLGDVVNSLAALQDLVLVGLAATATGSPAAAAAIETIGVELVVWIAESILDIYEQIDRMIETQQKYEQQEQTTTTSMTQVAVDIGTPSTTATAPSLSLPAGSTVTTSPTGEPVAVATPPAPNLTNTSTNMKVTT